jgi:hypothetical protein
MIKWLFPSKKDAVGDDRLSRYRPLREAGRNLNVALAKLLSKDAVLECGKKLGIAKAGMVIFNNDDEVTVLYDYCLYHHRRGNKTVIERYLEQSPPEQGSLDAALVQAMQQARFSIFLITAITPRQGAVVQDLVRGDTLQLVDLGIAETGMPGILLLGRLLPVDDFYMSTGSLIPVSEPVYQEKLLPIVKKFLPGDAERQQPLAAAPAAAYAAQMLRIALHAGGEDNVFYTDIARAG